MDVHILKTASYLVRKYKTRNPFEIMDQRYMDYDYTYRYPHLLGYYCVINRERFVRVNGNASQQAQEEAAMHELGHDVFDYKDACSGMTFQDTFFFSRSNSMRERRANLMSSEVLIEDNDILEPIGYYRYAEFYEKEKKRHADLAKHVLDYYTAMEFADRYGSDFLTTEQLSQALGRNQDLIEYKMKALLIKGYELPVTPELKADYLKR